jgi:hypothetical protein
MHNSTVESDGPQMTILMLFAYWITKATDTHSEYEYLLLFHGISGSSNAP